MRDLRGEARELGRDQVDVQITGQAHCLTRRTAAALAAAVRIVLRSAACWFGADKKDAYWSGVGKKDTVELVGFGQVVADISKDPEDQTKLTASARAGPVPTAPC